MVNDNILIESVRGIERINISDHFLSERKVFLTDTVTPESSISLIEKMMYLDDTGPGKEIVFYINSPGGEVTSGLGLYDVIKNLKSPVTTVCIGTAASMGAILFLSGTKRIMYPHTMLMIHDPSYHSADISGLKPHEIQKYVDSLKKTRDSLTDIIAGCCIRNRKEIEKLTREDSYFTAEEAVESGLATEIITYAK